MENGHVTVYDLWFLIIISINGLLLLHFCKWRMGMQPCTSYCFSSLSPLMDCYFYTSANGEWACNRVRLIGFLSLSPLMDCYFYTSTNGERACNRVRTYWFLFIVSINRLLLLHFYKWRMTCSRIYLIVFLYYLH